MKQALAKIFWWLLGGSVFFTVFAFALNNRSLVRVHWFFGYQSDIKLVLLVFVAFVAGALLALLAMLPLWWRQYQRAKALADALQQHSASEFATLIGGNP